MILDLSNPLILMLVSVIPAAMFWLGVAGEETDSGWCISPGIIATLVAVICWIIAFCWMAKPFLP